MKGRDNMKIEKNDIANCSSLTFTLLQQISKEADNFREKAIRLDKLNCALIHYIHLGKITDTKQIDAAASWERHSNLSIEEIMNIVLENDP